MRATSAGILGLGTTGLLGGLVVKALRPLWGTWADGSMVAGAVLLAAFLVVERSRLSGLASGRRVKYGANAILYTIVVAAIVGALNYVGSLHVKRFDLTEEKLYTLSPQSVKVLQELDRDVQVTAFFSSLHPQQQKAKDTLTLYGRGSARLKVTFVEPSRDPSLVEKLEVRADGTTVLESGKQKQTLTGMSEESLTNAIIKVSRDKQPRVYLVEGHGEMTADGAMPDRGIVQAKEQLVKKGFEVSSINLATSAEIPRDAALVIIADPRSPLPDRSQAILRQYLDEGGRALLLLEVRRDSGLGSLLADRGIAVGDDLVIDPTLRLLGGPAEAIVVGGRMFHFHPITDRFPFNVYLTLARSVGPKKDPPADVTVKTLFECSGDGWADTSVNDNVVKYEEGVDKPGPISLAVAASWKSLAAEAPPATPAAPAAPSAPAASPLAPNSETGAPEPPAVTPPAPLAEGTKAEQTITLGEPGPGSLTKTAAPPPQRRRYDEGRIVVVGDADWASDTILPDPGVGNAPLFVNMVGWLAETEEIIAVPPKKAGSHQMKLTFERGIALGALTLFVLPVGILGFGLTNWIRRRRL